MFYDIIIKWGNFMENLEVFVRIERVKIIIIKKRLFILKEELYVCRVFVIEDVGE